MSCDTKGPKLLILQKIYFKHCFHKKLLDSNLTANPFILASSKNNLVPFLWFKRCTLNLIVKCIKSDVSEALCSLQTSVLYVKLDFMIELVSNTNFTSILDAKQIQREQIILQMIKEITYNKKINIKLIAQAQSSAAKI